MFLISPFEKIQDSFGSTAYAGCCTEIKGRDITKSDQINNESFPAEHTAECCGYV